MPAVPWTSDCGDERIWNIVSIGDSFAEIQALPQDGRREEGNR